MRREWQVRRALDDGAACTAAMFSSAARSAPPRARGGVLLGMTLFGRSARALAVTLPILACLTVADTASAAVWGSFDATRINYDDGCLTCNANTQLAGLIEANGDTLAAPTNNLSAVYLDGIDVFYTSMLSGMTGSLSVGEQANLAAWIEGGGTLIVTAEFIAKFMVGPAYETFTAPYGVTNYAAGNGTGAAGPIAAHPIVAGVSAYSWNLGATFDVGPDALVLGNGAIGVPLIAVLEPDTDFCVGGRILVVGDHNVFNDGLIEADDNTLLADNVIDWAASPPPPCAGMGTGTDTGSGTDTGTSTGGSEGSSTDGGTSTEGGTSTTNGGGTTASADTTGGATGDSSDDGPGPMPDSSDGDGDGDGDNGATSNGVTTMPAGGDSTDASGDGTGGSAGSSSDDGGCRVGGDAVPTWGLLLVVLAWRRRAR